MLRVTVGKSRKLSQDYNSTGFSIAVDGEITAPLDSPEQILEQVQILHDLASESLQDQVDRLIQGDDGSQSTPAQSMASRRGEAKVNTPQHQPRQQPQNGSSPANAVAATDKQVQYLLNLGKQKGFSKSVYELSKAGSQFIGKLHIRANAGLLQDSTT